MRQPVFYVPPARSNSEYPYWRPSSVRSPYAVSQDLGAVIHDATMSSSSAPYRLHPAGLSGRKNSLKSLVVHLGPLWTSTGCMAFDTGRSCFAKDRCKYLRLSSALIRTAVPMERRAQFSGPCWLTDFLRTQFCWIRIGVPIVLGVI